MLKLNAVNTVIAGWQLIVKLLRAPNATHTHTHTHTHKERKKLAAHDPSIWFFCDTNSENLFWFWEFKPVYLSKPAYLGKNLISSRSQLS